MSRAIYALLVGVDDYPAPLAPLRGCVADVDAAAELLTWRAEASRDVLHLRVLRDGEATRQKVIDTFRAHLCQAEEGDCAVFWYAGHGAQEPALPEHYEIEPDHLNETLVLVDSRQPGSHDLADKELAQLVLEVSKSGAHVLVILDSCHSGSGVRALADSGEGVRRAPTDDRPRTRDTYLSLPDDVRRPEPAERADWLNLGPSARYVLLAACRSDQTAKEVRIAGESRGALSAALVGALTRAAGPVTYRDLHAWVAATVRTFVEDQTPILETPHAQDVTQEFLGGSASPLTPTTTASHHPDRGWVMNAGSLHGIPAPDSAAAVEVSLLDVRTSDPVADAAVRTVTATSATLEITSEIAPLDNAATYRAVLGPLPVARVHVTVVGDGADADEVREAIGGSNLTELIDPAMVDATDLLVTCGDGYARLTRGRGDRPLTADLSLSDSGSSAEVRSLVEVVARWQAIRDRHHPASRLPATAATLTAFDESGNPLPMKAGGVERALLKAPRPDGSTEAVIRVQFRNDSSRRLFYAVLVLSELFGVGSLVPGGGVWLDPGEEAWLLGDDGKPRLYLDVRDGQERTTDLFKLLVSTEEFDARDLAQDPLRAPTLTRGPELRSRDVLGSPRLPTSSHDWTTRELLVTTVRASRGVALAPDAPQTLAPGITVGPHPALQARAQLVSRATAARGAVVALVPPLLVEHPGISEPYSFGGIRTAGEDLTVLQLEGVTAAETVTAEHPLVITCETTLASDEWVLAVSSDGEDHLPLGVSHRLDDGRIEIRLVRLPAATPEGIRSLGGSLKLLFRKLVLRPLGFEVPDPVLSLVDYAPDGAPERIDDRDAIHARVATAQRAVLLVHGIIGDTQGMTEAFGAGPAPLHQDYDAVLAFDYENLDTPIDETAKMLRSRLEEIGLGPDTRLDVVAHSMGGLVSRCYVEREGGASAVARLVTCGTPHAGSPWPRVEDLALVTLTFVLNRVAEVSGPIGVVASIVGFLVRGVEGVDTALDQMQPGSPLLDELAASADPGVPYRAIAGDHPFGSASDPGVVARLVEKLRLPELALAALFGGEHDIAVSVESATSVGARWTSPPIVLDADCNHLSYFSSREGLAAVRTALID